MKIPEVDLAAGGSGVEIEAGMGWKDETAAAHPRSKQRGIRLRWDDLWKINKQPHRFIARG